MEEREISLVKGRQISLTKGLKQLKVEVVWEETRDLLVVMKILILT